MSPVQSVPPGLRTALRREKEVQLDVVRCYQRFGCEVYSLSQPRRTMQTPGIPDLYVFPNRGKLAFWHETKAIKGKQSDEQIVFEHRCRMGKVGYVLGGVGEALTMMKALGFVAGEVQGP